MTREEQKKRLTPLQSKICRLAMQDNAPREIYDILKGTVSADSITNALQRGRAHGLQIPRFRDRSGPRRIIGEQKEASAPVVAALTQDECVRLADLARRNVGLTAIATILRKPYRMIDEEMGRAGLCRAKP